MSWRFTVQVTPKAELQSALDAAELLDATESRPLTVKQVAAAKKTIKELSKLIQRDKVTASATGHAWNEADGAHHFDGMSINISGSE